MSSPRLELFDIVCNPCPAVPIPHRLAFLAMNDPTGVNASAAVGDLAIENAVVATQQGEGAGLLLAIPDVEAPAEGLVTMSGSSAAQNPRIQIHTSPVDPFEILLMPSSHLCFGYFTGIPEHIEAGRVVAQAVDLLDAHPEYRWNVEYCRGMANFAAKYPEKLEAARAHYRAGRLGVSPIWSPAFFEHYDAESQVRQLAESQWWLRENLGTVSPVAMGCDSPGFDPQQPQVFRGSGIDSFFRCRYTLWTKTFGSPLLSHRGMDGSRLSCFVSRSPLSDGYTYAPIPEMWAKGSRADRRATGFIMMVRNTARYIRDTKEICGANVGIHFACTDQGQADAELPDRLHAWNGIFRTPRLAFASLPEAEAKLRAASSFVRDDQEGEQPTWAPVGVAGYRLTHLLQQAAYALCTAEKAGALDLLVNSTPYPSAELAAAWLSVIEEQQHEQLGHAGHDAVEHSRDRLLRATATALDVTACAARRTAGKIAFRGKGRPVAVFNYLNWARRDIVEVPWAEEGVAVKGSDGRPVPHEVSADGSLRFLASVDALGYSTYYVEQAQGRKRAASHTKAGANWIENEFYRLDVDPGTGCAVSLLDKELGHDVLDAHADRLPFELVIDEDDGKGYCTFWPTGRVWRQSEIAGAAVRTEAGALRARCVVERPLLGAEGEPKAGSRMMIEYSLPAGLKRLDVTFTLDWDSPPKREARMHVPFALNEPEISYDTLFSTSRYDEDLPRRQRLYARTDSWPRDARERYFDWRNVTRFLSAYEPARDVGITISVPQGLMRAEHGGVSFTLLEERTDCYVHMIPTLKGRHVFTTSLTSHRGNWKRAKSWRFGWERRGRFNDLVAVSPERIYDLLPENGLLARLQGEDLVLCALKKSRDGEDLVARVYDASGDGGTLGFTLDCPYVGQRPFEIRQVMHGAVAKLRDRPLPPLSILRAGQADFLEDTKTPIPVEDLAAGRVSVKPHGILTLRMECQQPQRSWIPTYEVRTGDEVDEKEVP